MHRNLIGLEGIANNRDSQTVTVTQAAQTVTQTVTMTLVQGGGNAVVSSIFNSSRLRDLN
jgi:hypothetical protein